MLHACMQLCDWTVAILRSLEWVYYVVNAACWIVANLKVTPVDDEDWFMLFVCLFVRWSKQKQRACLKEGHIKQQNIVKIDCLESKNKLR